MLCARSCCVEQCPGSQAFVDHLLVDHVDLVNRDLPSWVHAHIYATHLLDFLGEKRHPKVTLWPHILGMVAQLHRELSITLNLAAGLHDWQRML